MKQTRKKHSAAFKAKVAVAVITGDRTVTESTTINQTCTTRLPNEPS